MSDSAADWAKAREMALRNLAELTPEEDAAITAAAEADPDNPPLDEETLSRMRPSAEVVPEFMAAIARRRGPQKKPRKEEVKLRLSPEVVAHFRATGPGWQTRIDEALRKVAGLE